MNIIAVAALMGAIGAVICLIDAARWNKLPLTLNRFFLLDGNLKLPGYVSTIVAANLSLGNFIIFITTWGYNFGLAGIIVFLINLCMNVVGFLVFLPRFRPYIESRDNNGTIHDYLSQSYAGDPRSEAAARIWLSASIVTVVCLVLAIVFEISLAVALLEPHNKLVQFQLFCAMAFLIALFTSYGGFRTLVASDIINSLIMLGGVCVLAWFIFAHATDASTPIFPDALTLGSFQQLGWPTIVSILFIGTGWMLVAMDQWQRTCASRSYQVTFRGIILYLFILGAFAVAFATWGAFAHNVLPNIVTADVRAGLVGASNPLADIQALATLEPGANLLIMFAVAALVFAGVSTTNTFLNVCSHSLTTDVLVGSTINRSMHELTPEQNRVFVGVARGIIVSLVALIVLVFAAFLWFDVLKDPLSFFYITYSVQFALLAPMVMSALSPKRRPSAGAALTSILLGFAISLGVGFGSWMLIQSGAGPILGLTAGDWLTLTPVVTLFAGLVPLVLGMRSS